MANNPLYPGYTPKKEDEGMNPLYSGYYPGAPMSRKPKPRNFVQPIPYSTDSLMEEIDALDIEVNNAVNYVAKRIKDDIKSSLKVSIKPSSVSATELDDYDVTSLPGASGISISVNPKDWRDPKKQIKKTLDSWRKTIIPDNFFERSDIDAVQQEHIWRNIVNPEGKSADPREVRGTSIEPDAGIKLPEAITKMGAGIAQDSFKEARDASLRRAVSSWGSRSAKARQAAGYNPLNLADRGIRDENDIDVFLKAGEAFVAFKGQEKMPKFREDAADTFRDTVGKAAFTEMELFLRENSERIANGETPLLNTTQEGLLRDFTGMASLGIDLNDLSSTYNSASKKLKKMNLRNDPDSSFRTELGSLKKKAASARSTLNGIEATLSEDAKSRYAKYLRETTQHLDSLDEFLGNLETMGGEITLGNRRKTLTRLNNLKSGQLIDRGLSGGHIAIDNTRRGLGKALIENDLVGAGANASGIHEVVRDLNLHTGDLGIYVNKEAVDRRVGKFAEIMNAVEEGEVIERYVWNDVIRKFEVVTPSYWIEKGKAKVDNFGLVIDEGNLLKEDGTANTLLGAVFRRDIIEMEKNPANVSAPGMILGHHFKREINGKKAKLYGGKHFKLIESKIKELSTEEGVAAEAEKMLYLLSGGKKISKGDLANIEYFKERLANNPKLAAALRAKFGKEIDLTDPNFWAILGKDSDSCALLAATAKLGIISDEHLALLKWVQKNKDLFGEDVDLSDPEFWKSLLTELGKEQRFKGSLDVTRRYSGLLEKVWTGLNKLQEAINKTAVGKALMSVANWKTIAAETISTVLAETIGKVLALLGAAETAGISAALERVITAVVKWIIDKVTKFATTIGKAILQGKVFEAIDEMSESAQKTVRRLMAAYLIPIMIGAAMISPFIEGAMNSFSPVDPTRTPPNNCKGIAFPKMFPGGMPKLYDRTSEYLALNSHEVKESVIEVYAQTEAITGVPCEILAGIHFMEGGNDPNKSLVSGRAIGVPEPDAGGMVFDSLLATAIYAAVELKGKMGIPQDQIENVLPDFETVVGGLSAYNGGGNANCSAFPKPEYGGPCPPPYFGHDDPYPMAWFDEDHDPMFLIYCADHTQCTDLGHTTFPEFERPGALEIGIWFHETYIGG